MHLTNNLFFVFLSFFVTLLICACRKNIDYVVDLGVSETSLNCYPYKGPPMLALRETHGWYTTLEEVNISYTLYFRNATTKEGKLYKSIWSTTNELVICDSLDSVEKCELRGTAIGSYSIYSDKNNVVFSCVWKKQ